MSTVDFSDISGFGRWSSASSPSSRSSSREMGSACGANDEEHLRFETPRTVASSDRLARLSGGGRPTGAVECGYEEDVGPDDLEFNDLSLYDGYCRSGGERRRSEDSSNGQSYGRMPGGGPFASPAASECKEDDDCEEDDYYYDDGLDGTFGDETMRLLAHAESRLGGAPNLGRGLASGGGGGGGCSHGGGSSPSPRFDDVEGCSPISARESGGSPPFVGGVRNDDSPSSAALHEMYRFNQHTASDDGSPIGPSTRAHYEYEDIDGLDEGSSLLRGPIMAARSAVSFASGGERRSWVTIIAETTPGKTSGRRRPPRLTPSLPRPVQCEAWQLERQSQ